MRTDTELLNQLEYRVRSAHPSDRLEIEGDNERWIVGNYVKPSFREVVDAWLGPTQDEPCRADAPNVENGSVSEPPLQQKEPPPSLLGAVLQLSKEFRELNEHLQLIVNANSLLISLLTEDKNPDNEDDDDGHKPTHLGEPG